MSVLRSKYMPDHLSDGPLLEAFKTRVGHDRVSTAHLLGHIAVIDERQLFRPAGYDSMFAYCVAELHLCEGAAYRRITTARIARELPILFEAVADGRLHLSGISVLSKHLSKSNVLELVAAARHKTRAQVEILIAERFPQKEPKTLIRAIPQRSNVAMTDELSPGRVAVTMTEQWQRPVEPPAASLVPAAAPAPSPRPAVKPVGPQRFSLQLTMDQSTYDKLRRAQELLSHAVPSGDVALVLDRALDALIVKLEKRKLGKTERPRTPKARLNSNSRHIPAHVMRAVQDRDQGQCTFVSESGHRCAARRFLEYDHIEPVARGGETTADNIRLRCRAHNQYEAEQIYGAGFMHQKREAARRGLTGAAANQSPNAALS